MKSTHFKLVVLCIFLSVSSFAQQFSKPLQEFKVGSHTDIFIEASYAEIEIIEWNKNKVEIEALMSVQGLSEDQAQELFDGWDISAQADAQKIMIRSSSSNFGSEYFFINNDKYIGNVTVDVPKMTGFVIDILDSVPFVLPEFDNFPDINVDLIQNFQFAADSLAFDYEAFERDSEYLTEWQEEHKAQMKKLKQELKENQLVMAREQEHMQREMRDVQKEAMEAARASAREAHIEIREAQKEMAQKANRDRMIAKGARERAYEVQRIMQDRQKVKVKKTLRIKVPKNAKLDMDVDYCKISTIK